MKATQAAKAILLLSVAGLLGVAGPVAPCDANEDVDFCGLERAEDVAFLPGSAWFAVSTASQAEPLVFIDARRRTRVVLAPPFAPPDPGTSRRAPSAGAADCPGPPARLRAGGNDIKRGPGGLQLALLNRAEPGAAVRDGDERIELFALSLRAGRPRAEWTGCVPVPARFALNDVALAPDGMLYGSHQFDRPASPGDAAATRRRWLEGAPTGHAVQWTARGGWSPVPGTEVSFANGVAVSLDGRTLAVAGTYSSALLQVDRRRGTVRRVPLPLTPDNVTALERGRFLVTGHTGVPVTGVDPCRDPKAVPCGFPFAVAELAAGGPARVVFAHDGSRIPGASVAAPLGRRLYLGSFFGDRVSVVERTPADPPR